MHTHTYDSFICCIFPVKKYICTVIECELYLIMGTLTIKIHTNTTDTPYLFIYFSGPYFYSVHVY